jgi:hypothetical protein
MTAPSERHVAIVNDLFAAWSSGDPEAPRPFLTDQAVLWDVIGGEYQGWPAIRDYFAKGLQSWPDLALVPTGEFWFRSDGLALTWRMSATVRDDRFGPEAVGRRWYADGMSFVVFEGDQVSREVDFHDGGSRARSLQQP